MHGGTYVCDKCDYSMAHFSSEDDKRMACINCDGWMHPIETEPYVYKKPNIIWLGMAHVIWFFLRPISEWVDRHDIEDEDD